MENTRSSNGLDSLYARYSRERAGAEVHYTEHGFITYVLSGGQCLIRELFVPEEFRGKGYAKQLYAHVENLAKKSGCKFISGMVDIADKMATENVQKFTAHGFVLVRAEANTVVLGKEI